MGKYMRRAKTTGDFAVMEVSSKSSFGVRTRAKTLALQRLQNSSPSPDDSFCFLQLRSRRLEKFLPSVIKHKDAFKETVRSSSKPSPKLTLMAGSGSVRRSRAFELTPCSGGINFGSATSQSPLVNDAEDEVEVSCGENMLEVEEMNRKTRETTPTSLIRNSEDIGTPGSSTRPSKTTISNRSSVHRNIPTTREIDEFFKGVEQSQLKLFTEKYNYDPVNDCPLPGQYEWVKLV
ncbi:hypothetical protein M5K25_001768 [Dendrobium thyrsiflorum]|uniref:Cyclin-dependent kinase inhibitor domain-containing protein n=1 Tax=Dendrobium thyrsiflorum TaxID=117978 RepID=A0ABD0VRD4_DENTH